MATRDSVLARMQELKTKKSAAGVASPDSPPPPTSPPAPSPRPPPPLSVSPWLVIISHLFPPTLPPPALSPASLAQNHGQHLHAAAMLKASKERKYGVHSRHDDGFPWKGTAAICLANVSQYYAVCSLFSSSGLMAVDLKWSKDSASAGLTAGWLVSSIIFGRLFTAGLWGNVADTYGRRPALFATLTSLAVGNLAFGFCTNFAAALVVLFLFLGAGNGFMTIVGILSCEIGGRARQTRVVAYMLAAGGFTALAGPALAGYLYGTCPRFPALASSLVGTALPLGTLRLAYLWLPETAPPKGVDHQALSAPLPPPPLSSSSSPPQSLRTLVAHGDDAAGGKHDSTALLAAWRGSSSDAERHDHAATVHSPAAASLGVAELAELDADDAHLLPQTFDLSNSAHGDARRGGGSGGGGGRYLHAKPGTAALLRLLSRDPLLLRVVALRALNGFHSYALLELVPLWAIAPPSAGGLGFGQVAVGHLCALASLASLGATLGGMARFVEAVGLRRAMYAGSLAAAAGFAAVPCVSAGWGFGNSLAAAAGCYALASVGCQTLTTAIFAATNNLTRPETRGLVNGVATTVEGLGKLVAPALTATLFALSLRLERGQHTWAHGLVFWALAATELSLIAGAACLPADLESGGGGGGEGGDGGGGAAVSGGSGRDGGGGRGEAAKAIRSPRSSVMGVPDDLDLSTLPSAVSGHAFFELALFADANNAACKQGDEEGDVDDFA